MFALMVQGFVRIDNEGKRKTWIRSFTAA